MTLFECIHCAQGRAAAPGSKGGSGEGAGGD
eukprot:COSAG06_NODE_15520_length_1064_cov_78.425907_1_plen_30_part_10